VISRVPGGSSVGAVGVIDWLMEGDPAIRWQVMRDLTDAPVGDVARERSLVAEVGWGRRLLDLQGEDGRWGGGAYSPKWISTTYTLLDLRHLGVDPAGDRVRSAIQRVAANVTMGDGPWPFFAYRGETCITGMVLGLAAHFAVDDDLGAVDFLLDQRREDGGWNCDWGDGSTRSSFNTTLSVLEGLWQHEQARGADRDVAQARTRAQEYLLERHLMRRKSTGEIINRRWLLFSFPPRWFYDVLRALDYLRSAGVPVDDRCNEALSLLQSKRRVDGTWPLQNPHPGRVHFQMEDGAGKPSRWNTLRAMRVLRWAGRLEPISD